MDGKRFDALVRYDVKQSRRRRGEATMIACGPTRDQRFWAALFHIADMIDGPRWVAYATVNDTNPNSHIGRNTQDALITNGLPPLQEVNIELGEKLGTLTQIPGEVVQLDGVTVDRMPLPPSAGDADMGPGVAWG